MLVSLNWLRDFIDIPAALDRRELAQRFTITTAEVEGVEHHEPGFSGLMAARVEKLEPVSGEAKLRRVSLAADQARVTLSSAPQLEVGDLVIYGPPGAMVAGNTFASRDPAGRLSDGMIVAGQGIGLNPIGPSAVFLPPSFKPGQAIPVDLFDDWLIEIDNKSITHRPDCWGHYGIAREFAAMLDLQLKPYPTTDEKLLRSALPSIPIEIDDPAACPRFTGLLMKGLKPQPSPLWMQVRLALCGIRPIDLIVDLTNYIMLELGQPMHAYDGEKMKDIQVAMSKAGEKFTTLDGISRALPTNTLMIQSGRKHVGIAGIMGGAATEVSPQTTTVLLEAANFDAPTIRRSATAMGHRTEASARFEKSLDPANTVLGIARFHHLARMELPSLELASTLSDCYPRPHAPKAIELDCDFTASLIGKAVHRDEITRILSKLEFRCEPGRGAAKLLVTPPTFRATKDIEIEADLIEEVARFVGYNNIEPSLPVTTTRFFESQTDLALEERTLTHFCEAGEFVEVHDYIWYDDAWLKRLNFDPGECITLRNPAAEGCARLRKSLAPGLLAMAERNRHHFDRFGILEIGSVFEPGGKEIEKSQHRRLAALSGLAGKKADATIWDRLRTALEGWSMSVLESAIEYKATKPQHPWEDSDRLAEICVEGRAIGRVTIVPLACKQRIDERLKAWAIALVEMNLSSLAERLGTHRKLPAVPRYPQVQLDFSVLANESERFESIRDRIRSFKHGELRRLGFVDAYQGGSIPAGRRSITLRAEIGRDDRTLSDDEIHQFQKSFRTFLVSAGWELRG